MISSGAPFAADFLGFLLTELCLFRAAYSMASLLRERARPDPEEPFWTLVLGAKLLLAATLMLGLAAAGLLSAFSCIAVCVAAAAVAEAALRRFRPAAPAPPPSRRGLTQAAIAAGTAAIFLRLVLARLKPTSETDSVVHLGLLAKWIQQGEGIYNFPYSYSSFYEASLLPALAVGKYDALISLLSLQSVALFAAALFHISRRVLSTPLAAGAATLHGALYYHLWAGVSGVGTAKNDMIYNAGILLFVLGFIRLFRGERGPATVALAALGAAFAAVKFSGPFAALIVVISAGWAFAAAGRIREFLGGIRAGMPAVLAVALFTNGHFYLRNLLLHGNPLYPQKLKVLGFMLPGTVDFSGTSILSQWDNPLIWRAFLATVQEGFFYPGSVVAPFLLAAAALPLKRLRGGSPVLFLALTASGLWLLFMASLWSAGMYPGQTDIIQARLSLRYASAAAALGTLAIAAAAEGIWPRAAMVVTAAVAADAAHRWYRLLPTTWYLRAAGVDAGLASGAGLIVLAAAFAARRRLRPYVFAAIYAILLLSLPRLAERIRPVAWAGGEADVFQHLALAPASTVWSIVGEDTWHLIYPLTGGRYQHRVIEVDTQTASRRLEKCEDLPEYVHIHGYSDFPSKTRARLEPGLTGCGFNPLSQSPYGILFRRMQG